VFEASAVEMDKRLDNALHGAIISGFVEVYG
jgi:hypothetical protein